MTLINKIIIGILLMFAISMQGQTYPKYTTSKGKGTTTPKKEKPADTQVKQKPSEKPKIAEAQVTDVPVEKPKEEQPEVKIPQGTASFNDLFSKAGHLYKEKKYDEAVKTYTEALAIAPDEWKHLVLQFRAYSYLGKKEYDKAITDCTTAIEKTKVPNKNAIGHLSFVRSQAYLGRNNPGDKERACADYKKARETGFLTGMDLPGYDCK